MAPKRLITSYVGAIRGYSKYNPYAVDWRFLPEIALLAKDYVRHNVVYISNVAASKRTLSPLWLATVGRRTVKAIRSAQVLFIHIPKTGGTSISSCLYGKNLPHYTAKFYFDVFGPRLSNLPSFSIIRHPVERFVSAYKMAIAGGTDIVAYDRYDRFRLRGLSSIEYYVDFLFEHKASLLFLPRELREQVSFIQNAEGRVLVDRLFPLDCNRGLPKELGRWLGISHIPHLNVTGPRDIDVSQRAYHRILEIYCRDYQLYVDLIQNMGPPIEGMEGSDKNAKRTEVLRPTGAARFEVATDGDLPSSFQEKRAPIGIRK